MCEQSSLWTVLQNRINIYQNVIIVVAWACFIHSESSMHGNWRVKLYVHFIHGGRNFLAGEYKSELTTV